MDNKERNITPEEAVILWHASRLDLSKNHEQAPEILKVQAPSSAHWEISARQSEKPKARRRSTSPQSWRLR